MKRISGLAALTAAVIINIGAAHAHGDLTPRHGGIVEMSGEVKFELVARPDGAELYLDDHGVTMPTEKLTGKLTVTSGSATTEARLEPAADDKLVARGVRLVKGAKVIALVTMEDKSKSSALFVIK